MANSSKLEQYAQQIQNEVNSLLRGGMNNPALSFVSITKVELTNDFSYATLYWDTFDPSKRGDIAEALKRSTGKIRSHLAKNLKVRTVPEIKVKYDSQYEDQNEIESLLEDERKKGKDF